MVSVPIQPKSLAEEIAEILQHSIIAGEFEPGQRLIERELVARFRVSSIPIREALQALESRGLVVRRHNVGCSVVQLAPEEAEAICDLRRVLEPKVMEWAARRMTRERDAALRAQFDRLSAAARRRDFAAFFQEDLEFHKLIWDISGNRYAARALETAMGSLFASGLIGAGQRRAINLAEELAKHQRLLLALCAGAAKEAAAALLDIAAGFERHLPGRGDATA